MEEKRAVVVFFFFVFVEERLFDKRERDRECERESLERESVSGGGGKRDPALLDASFEVR
jgi:hypothetical protein